MNRNGCPVTGDDHDWSKEVVLETYSWQYTEWVCVACGMTLGPAQKEPIENEVL